MLKRFENPFVIPIRVPEWFGDKSMWFTLYPLNTAALNPTATISSPITTPLSVSNRLNKIRATAGIPTPKTSKHIFFFFGNICEVVDTNGLHNFPNSSYGHFFAGYKPVRNWTEDKTQNK